MSKIETNVNNLKINRGTYEKIQENIASIGENELIITTDKNVPVPAIADAGKVIGVNSSGEYALTNDVGKVDDVKVSINGTATSIVANKIATLLLETSLGVDSNNPATVTAIRAFVNSSIEAIAANYITSNAAGDAFSTKAELDAGPYYYAGSLTTLSRNDYAVVIADETHGGQSARYTYTMSGTTGQWAFQYPFNMTFTQAQINALNSGITAAKVAIYDGYAAQIAAKQDIIQVTAMPTNPETGKIVQWIGNTTYTYGWFYYYTGSFWYHLHTEQPIQYEDMNDAPKIDQTIVQYVGGTTTIEPIYVQGHFYKYSTNDWIEVDTGSVGCVRYDEEQSLMPSWKERARQNIGAQDEITTTNKLSADLVDDTSTTNKFVSATQKNVLASAITNSGIGYSESTTITWDGDTTGKEIAGVYYKVDSTVLSSVNDYIGATIIESVGGTPSAGQEVVSVRQETLAPALYYLEVNDSQITDNPLLIATQTATLFDMTFTKGVWFAKLDSDYIASLTYGSTHKISSDMVDDTNHTNKFVPTVATADKDKYLHTNASTGALEWTEVQGGTGAVRYDEAQTLTSEQQTQAQSNIGLEEYTAAEIDALWNA